MDSHLDPTLWSHRLPPLAVPGTLEEELEWFFALREGADHPLRDLGFVGWEPIAFRTIASWLAPLDSYHVKMLELAFGPASWPLALRRRLGCVTGVVVHLATVESGWPPDREEQRRREQSVAKALDEEHSSRRRRSVTRYIEPAVGVLRAAVRAYSEVRGPGPSMVIPQTHLFDPEEPSVEPPKPSVEPEEPSVEPMGPSVEPEEPSVDTEGRSVQRENVSVEPHHSSVHTTEAPSATTQPSCITAGARSDELLLKLQPMVPSSASVHAKGGDLLSKTRPFDATSVTQPERCAI